MAPLAVALLAGAALAALAPAPAAGPLAARRLHLSRPGTASDSVPAAATSPQVHWQVDAGRAKEGVAQWAARAASLGAITGLTGCCGRFSVEANGTFRDEWPEGKYPLSDWDFAHRLGLTMHFVFTVDQNALLNRTALLAIEPAVRIAVAQNFTGYSLDYETAPAGASGSPAFAKECDGLLEFITRFAAALREYFFTRVRQLFESASDSSTEGVES